MAQVRLLVNPFRMCRVCHLKNSIDQSRPSALQFKHQPGLFHWGNLNLVHAQPNLFPETFSLIGFCTSLPRHRQRRHLRTACSAASRRALRARLQPVHLLLWSSFLLGILSLVCGTPITRPLHTSADHDNCLTRDLLIQFTTDNH